MIKWNDEIFSVGIRKMDEQHKKLIGLINALAGQRDIQDKEFFDKVFATLVMYTRMHFVDEEKILQKLHYPGLNKHHEHHEQFIRTVTEMKGQFEQQGAASAEMVDGLSKFLSDWITHHILIEDKAYGQYLES